MDRNIVHRARKAGLSGFVVMDRNIVAESAAGELYVLRAGRWLRVMPVGMSPRSSLRPRKDTAAPVPLSA